jgi:hypothetical protein
MVLIYLNCVYISCSGQLLRKKPRVDGWQVSFKVGPLQILQLCGRYYDLICKYNLPLDRLLSNVFYIVLGYRIPTTENPVYLINTDGSQRVSSVDRICLLYASGPTSSQAKCPTFAYCNLPLGRFHCDWNTTYRTVWFTVLYRPNTNHIWSNWKFHREKILPLTRFEPAAFGLSDRLFNRLRHGNYI